MEASEKAKELLPAINYCKNPYEAAQFADAILIITEWDEFRAIDWQRLASVVERCLIIDGRNMFNPSDVTAHGFQYVSIGRLPGVPEPTAVADTLIGDIVPATDGG